MIYCNTRNLLHHKTGVQRYTEEILKRFPKKSWNPIQPNESIARGIKGHVWEQVVMPFKMRKEDILWSPSNTGPINHKKQVVTIHDVVPFEHPEWLNRNFSNWYRLLQPKLVKNIKRIITISQFSKQRIIEYLGVSEEKVEVIYNGVSEKFFDNKKKLFSNVENVIPSQNYILSLGSLEPRKNLKRLLYSWSKVEKFLPEDFYLVIVGKQGSSLVFEENTLDENLNKVIFTGHLPDEILPALYGNALAFFYLSEYEGFGLPPLEAMASGTPIVASDTTAIPEVVGSCGRLIDPFSIEEISNSIILAAEGKVASEKKVKEGIERAKSFSWDKTANKTWDVLLSV